MTSRLVPTTFPWIVALPLALLLAFSAAAPGQTADPAALRRQIDTLETQIDTYSRLLEDPSVVFLPGNVYGDMTGRFVDGPYVPMTQEEFLNAATDYYAFGGIANEAPDMSLREFLTHLVHYSDQARRGLEQEQSRLIRERDGLIYQLEQYGDQTARTAASPWIGDWALTYTYQAGTRYLLGESFGFPISVRPAEGSGCIGIAWEARAVVCRIAGNHLTLSANHPTGGRLTFEMDLAGNTVSGTFQGTLTNFPNVSGSVQGRRN